MSVDEDKSWACTPVSQKAGFDVLKLNLAVKKGVFLEENHGYDERVARLVSCKDKTSKEERTGSDVVCRPAKTLDVVELLLGEHIEVKFDVQYVQRFGEL